MNPNKSASDFVIANDLQGLKQFALLHPDKVNAYHLMATPNIQQKSPYFLNRPLEIAIKLRNLPMVKYLIQKGANPNDRGYETNPLIQATRLGNIQLIKTLLENGADPRKKTEETKNNAFYTAVFNNKLSIPIVKLFLEHGYELKPRTLKFLLKHPDVQPEIKQFLQSVEISQQSQKDSSSSLPQRLTQRPSFCPSDAQSQDSVTTAQHSQVENIMEEEEVDGLLMNMETLLRQKKKPDQTYKNRLAVLPKATREELKFWESFLRKASFNYVGEEYTNYGRSWSKFLDKAWDALRNRQRQLAEAQRSQSQRARQSDSFSSSQSQELKVAKAPRVSKPRIRRIASDAEFQRLFPEIRRDPDLRLFSGSISFPAKADQQTKKRAVQKLMTRQDLQNVKRYTSKVISAAIKRQQKKLKTKKKSPPKPKVKKPVSIPFPPLPQEAAGGSSPPMRQPTL